MRAPTGQAFLVLGPQQTARILLALADLEIECLIKLSLLGLSHSLYLNIIRFISPVLFVQDLYYIHYPE